jgi:hypothetical protein
MQNGLGVIKLTIFGRTLTEYDAVPGQPLKLGVKEYVATGVAVLGVNVKVPAPPAKDQLVGFVLTDHETLLRLAAPLPVDSNVAVIPVPWGVQFELKVIKPEDAAVNVRLIV